MRRWMVWLSVACCCGIGASHAQEKPAEKPQPTEAQKQAVAQIKKLGGLVLEIAQNDPRLDVAFHLADAKITDAELALVKPLTQVAYLNLRGTEITDAGLAHLAELKGLVRLHLEKTKITDAGLEHLKGLENLEYLNLYGTAVTDAGLKHLEGLKKLKKLYLWQTQVTDAGVSALKQALPELQIVRGLELAQPAASEKKPEEKKE